MTIPPELLRARGGVFGSDLTRPDGRAYSKTRGVGADPVERDADADEEEEPDAIRRGIQELPCRQDSVRGGDGGGYARGGALPASMWARTFDNVLPSPPHQRMRPSAFFFFEGGGGPSYSSSSRCSSSRKNRRHSR